MRGLSAADTRTASRRLATRTATAGSATEAAHVFNITDDPLGIRRAALALQLTAFAVLSFRR